VLRGIDYVVEECPMAEGNKHLGYKAALNAIEDESPGSKHAFYFGFLREASPLFSARTVQEAEGLGACDRCGAPTTKPQGGPPPGPVLCAFCRLTERVTGHEPVAFKGRR
jgi:hypothetical protein